MRKRVSFIFLSIMLLNYASASAKDDYSHALFDLFETLRPVGIDIAKMFSGVAKETNVPEEFKLQFQTCIDQEIAFLFKALEPYYSKYLSLNDLQDLTAKLTLPAGTNFLKLKAGKLDKTKLSAAQIIFNEAMDKSEQFKNFELALKLPTDSAKYAGIAFAKYCQQKVTSTTNQSLLNSGITIPVPAYWQVQTLDIGEPFGKSDVLVDESMSKVITFMSFPNDVIDNKTFATGIYDGFTKQNAKHILSGDFMINNRKIFVISGILNVEGVDDHRTYVIDGKSKLMVLFQLGDVDVTKQVVFKNVVRAL